MATYLVVRNGEKKTSYKCNSTYTSQPYLKVKDNCYLDLTTRTSSGLQLNVKVSKRTDTFVTTTGYKGYFSCRQSTASGKKMSSNGVTYNTTDYEPFVNFTSTGGWATRNTTYTRTSYNVGVLSSTSALTRTSSLFNKGIYHIANTTSTLTNITSRSQVNFTVSTSTSRSSQRRSTSGYSGISSYTRSRASTSSYAGKRASTYTYATWYSGYRASRYTYATSYAGYTKTSSFSRVNITGYGGNTFAADGGHSAGQGNVTWNNAQNDNPSAEDHASPVNNYNPRVFLVRNTANGQWYIGNSNRASRYSQIKEQRNTTFRYSTTAVNNAIYYTATRASVYTSANANGMLSATAKYNTATRTSQYTSANANGMLSATALTRSSRYWTSARTSLANSNGLLSTTALTRTSYYTVSTSTSRSSSSYSNYSFTTTTSMKTS